MDNRIIDRCDEISYNNIGLEMQIVRYKNKNDIDVEFKNPYCLVKNAKYKNFKSGYIKNYMNPIVYDVGYIGKQTKTKTR